MGFSRLEEDDVCLRCGGVIINLNPKLRMCSACEAKVTEIANRQIQNRKSSQKQRFKIKLGSLRGIRLGSKG